MRFWSLVKIKLWFVFLLGAICLGGCEHSNGTLVQTKTTTPRP